MNLDSRLKEVFADTFEVGPDEITEDMSVASCATWDSLRSITLSFSVEQAFDVEFSETELMTIESYSAVRALLLKRGLS